MNQHINISTLETDPLQTMASSKTKLSTRGEALATPTGKMTLSDVICDLWHPETNPGGYVSLGVAENVCYFGEYMTMARLTFGRP